MSKNIKMEIALIYFPISVSFVVTNQLLGKSIVQLSKQKESNLKITGCTP